MNIMLAQEAADVKFPDEILHKILTFIYFLAHQIGLGILKVIQAVFPRTIFPDSLIDPLGFLVILTLVIFLAGIAKKVAWIIVCVGWIFIFIRILLILFKLG